MNNIFIHIHIPKCGGSTIYDYLKFNFNRNVFRTTGILNNYTYDKNQISEIIRSFPNVKCISGHKISLDLPFDDPQNNIIAITWIRNPVDRFISHYFYHRNHTNIVPQAKQMIFSDYIDWALLNKNNEKYINGQRKYLNYKSLDYLESLLRHKRLFLFPMDRIPESIYSLSNEYPKNFKYINLTQKNISFKNIDISDDLKKTVAEYMKDDYELYNIACQSELPSIPSSFKQSYVEKFFFKILKSISSKLIYSARKIDYINSRTFRQI